MITCFITASFANADIKNTTAKLSNHVTKYTPTSADDIETQYKKLKTINNNTTIAYKNLLKGMTLEYVLSANNIKENIIVEKADDSYTYTFTYELIGLLAVLNDNGSVILIDELTQEPAYEIPAPYMYDANNVISNNVSYALNNLKNGIYELTVSADETWINSNERTFPVVIDPTIEPHLKIDAKDTYISSSTPNTNYGRSENLWVSSQDIVFMDFGALPTIDKNATILFAKLNLYYYYHISTGGLTLRLYQALEDWEENTLTWNIANEREYMGISPLGIEDIELLASSTTTEANPNLEDMEVIYLVRAWYAGLPNYGIVFQYQGGTNASVILKSRETDTCAYYEISYNMNPLIINTGNYRIQNQEFSDKYMQMNVRNSILVGDIVELKNYTGYDDQKWSIEYLHNGYYKIISVETGKALTAPDEVNDALTHADYVADSTQMWSITAAGNNLFKLSPNSNSSYYMAAGDTIASSNGLNVEMREQRADYKDEWVIESTGTKAIFVLPGMLGSSLAKTNGTDVWLHYLNFSGLALAEDGTSVYDVVSINKDNYGANDTYAYLYDGLNTAYGNEFDVVFFDYDFRFSIDEAAMKLERETAFYDEVVLVAHSMGGLVGAKYLASSVQNRNRTAALITLGTPFTGSAQCINVMETGKLLFALQFANIDIYAFTGTLKAMSKNCFAAYQLLPTSMYYGLTGEHPLMINRTNYTGVYAKLRNTDWGKMSDGTDKPMFNKAVSFHSSLMSNGVYILNRSDVMIYTIAGSNIDTIKKVILDSNYNVIDLAYSAEGDGLVLNKSAGYGTPDKIIYGTNHTGLVSNAEALATVKSIITQTTGINPNAEMTVIPGENIETFGASHNTVNSRGWLNGFDNRRINIYADIDARLMIDNMEAIEKGEVVYDTSGNKIGAVWSIGNSGKKLYALYNGTYSVTHTAFTKVQYMNGGYYDKIIEYDSLNKNTINILVSDYDSQEITVREIGGTISSKSLIQPSKIYSDADLIELNTD